MLAPTLPSPPTSAYLIVAVRVAGRLGAAAGRGLLPATNGTNEWGRPAAQGGRPAARAGRTWAPAAGAAVASYWEYHPWLSSPSLTSATCPLRSMTRSSAASRPLGPARPRAPLPR